MSLIIVESPTKAKTFNKIIKTNNLNHFVFATFGHIRDLPKNKLAIDYNHQFKPNYQIITSKKKIVDSLKKLAEKNEEIILATDLDREGEAIGYHVAYILGFIEEKWPELILKENNKKLLRIIFHEITPKALVEALNNPVDLRLNLVKAQNTRRILDRIVGYELSPILWKKTGKKWLSAGRVQTVALRLIVEREREIERFVREKYYQIYGFFQSDSQEFKSKLIEFNGEKYEQLNKIILFDGEYQFTKTTIDKEKAEKIINDLKTDQFFIEEIKEEINYRYPPPPFITASLQQESFQKLGFSSKMTMKLAQDLYEEGYITYHRTDSFNLSSSFVFSARDYIEKKYGKNYLPERPRGFKTKSKIAQEAHEAIRPTRLDKEIDLNNNDSKLTKNHKRLYRLIYNRALATQMKEAEIKTIKIFIRSKKNYLFQSESSQVLFPGFLIVLNPDFIKDKSQILKLKKGEKLNLKDLITEEKETLPPFRYTEASLIKSLEEKGIGRPSTYASIISLIQEKNYVEKESRYFKPTLIGINICQFLCENFPKIFDLDFTAKMEDQLDQIANNERNFIETLNQFYQPFKEVVERVKENNQLIEIKEEAAGVCPQCQNPLVIRYSKFGKFYACSRYPKCGFTKPFFKIVENKKCPQCGSNIIIRYSKNKKKFFGCENYPKCQFSSWKISEIPSILTPLKS